MTPPNYESFEEKSEVFKENFKIPKIRNYHPIHD